MVRLSSLQEYLSSPAALVTLAVGAAGGLLGFLVGEAFQPGDNFTSLQTLLIGTGVWVALIGTAIGAVVLAYDNTTSLRGSWWRDMPLAIPLIIFLGFIGGAVAQGVYGVLASTGVLNSLWRGLGWALMGVSIGVGIGLARRDLTQTLRGALGGVVGGFIGGFIFDGIAMVIPSGDGAFSRAVGLILTGAAIAICIAVVRETLKTAWLLGTSSGPIEGKQVAFTKSRMTLGRAGSNDIALTHDEAVAPNLGEFVFEGTQWKWRGGQILVNGTPTTQAVLENGYELHIGNHRFRFNQRGAEVITPVAPIASPQGTYANQVPPMVPQAPRVAQRLWLEALTPQAPKERIELENGTYRATIGRASTNQITLFEATVSGDHALLESRVGQLVLTDVGSTNGTFVNGSRLAPQLPTTLLLGDRVQIGRLEYIVKGE